jgi:hypothetical protein
VKIKAILDTNVFISGVFWNGPPFEILKALQEQRFRLAISLPILDEYRRVLDELAKKRQMPVLNSSSQSYRAPLGDAAQSRHIFGRMDLRKAQPVQATWLSVETSHRRMCKSEGRLGI